MNITVIGSGSWGTAISQLLALNAHKVCLYCRREVIADTVNKNHANPDYLSSYTLSNNITAISALREASGFSHYVIVAVPSKFLRNELLHLAKVLQPQTHILLLTKGIENQTGLLMEELVREVLPQAASVTVLSGPNHAEEIINLNFAASVISSRNTEILPTWQHILSSKTFRVYTSPDIVGVEICGAVKNVLAIAYGVSQALGYGDNASCALMTRGLAEMSRLVAFKGGDPLTCMGLAGVGDLFVTCTSSHSRNSAFGYAFIQGEDLNHFNQKSHMVVEGAEAVKSIHQLSLEHDLSLPICNAVFDMLYQNSDPKTLIHDLLSRPLTHEFYDISEKRRYEQ